MVFWLLILLFVLSRLYHLTVMPPFLDEFIYIRWLNQIRAFGDWLIPLHEFGWEPLQIWLAAGINRLTPNPLLALRLTAVFAGAVSFWFLIKIGGKTAGLFFLISPLVLLHDRLGLRGDQVVILAAIMVYYGLKRRQPWWWGLGIGLGLLAKTTAAALPVVVVLSYIWLKRKPKAIDFCALGLTALAPVFYFFSGTLNLVLAKQTTFVGEALIKNNLVQIGEWLWQYLTWPVVLLTVAGILAARKDKLLLISALTPLVLLVFSAKILFPRYLLPIMPFLVILAAAGFNWLKQALPRTLRPLLAVFLLAPVWFSWRILTDLPAAPLPEIDNWQYVSGWPSGYGVKELTDYLKADQLMPLQKYSAEEILTDKAIGDDYAITNIDHEKISGELIKEFPRPGNKSSLKLWQLE